MPQTLWAEVAQQISAATGERFEAHRQQSLGGGCINSAYVIQDGERRYFVKTNDARHAAMFAAEAVGLEAIVASKVIRAPRPICHGTAAGHAFLVLDYIALGDANSRTARALGEALAAMHRTSQNQFGFAIDNTIGATPQINAWCHDWVAFYGEHRLRYQFALAARNGLPLLDEGERLIANLPAFFANYQPIPSLLHGDLWGGNWGSDETGSPVIFDPACYYGDREADIAMTELFGGFPATFYQAYQDAFPLDIGYDVRKKLYNLYHILNHFNMFGGGYGAQARSMVGSLNAQIA